LLSLYLHFPWCIKKCPYCDFNSHAIGGGSLPEEQYLQALLQDLLIDSKLIAGQEISTIFLGGGTPSLFSAQAFEKVFSNFNKVIPIAKDAEITLEANPGTIECGKFADYKKVGINRVSLGVQSFNDKHLKKLGRIHSADTAKRAIDELHAAGISNFNIDLMHGLPDQTAEMAQADLKTAIKLQPSHISWYQLTIEPNTVFYSKPPKLPVDDDLFAIEEAGKELLAEAGFRQYEVSAYSRLNKQCQHNLNYWRFGDYLGVGAGAHGKLTLVDGAVIRTSKKALPRAYLAENSDFLREKHQLKRADLIAEFMLNALRLNSGFSLQLFSEQTGLNAKAIQSKLDQAIKKGLLQKGAENIKTTALGARFLNECLEVFMA